MAEVASKSGTKSLVWDYFGLQLDADGKPVDDGSAVCRSCRKRVLAKHGNTSNLLAHLRTNHPAVHSQAKAAMDAKGKLPARKATPVPSTSSQLTNPSKVDDDRPIVRAKRSKMEGANRHSNIFHCQRLSSHLHGGEKRFQAAAKDV